jgi:hypothetical protein
MMMSVWITLPVLMSFTLGFAGLLGTHIYHLRNRVNSHQVAVAFAIGGLVMLPPLSLPPLSQWIGWLAATLVVVLFALRPHILPPLLWTLRFGFRYASLAMILIAIGILCSKIAPPLYLLSVLALLAGGLSWFRSKSLPT